MKKLLLIILILLSPKAFAEANITISAPVETVQKYVLMTNTDHGFMISENTPGVVTFMAKVIPGVPIYQKQFVMTQVPDGTFVSYRVYNGGMEIGMPGQMFSKKVIRQQEENLQNIKHLSELEAEHYK